MIRKPRILLWEEDLSIMESSAFNALTNYLNEVSKEKLKRLFGDRIDY